MTQLAQSEGGCPWPGLPATENWAHPVSQQLSILGIHGSYWSAISQCHSLLYPVCLLSHATICQILQTLEGETGCKTSCGRHHQHGQQQRPPRVKVFQHLTWLLFSWSYLMVVPIDMKQKGSASNEYWANCDL